MKLINCSFLSFVFFFTQIAHLRDAQYHYENWLNSQNDTDASIAKRGRSMARMQQSLCAAQDIGDEKLQVVNQLQEFIDTKTRQLEQDQQALDYGKDSQMADVLSKECLPMATAIASPIHVNAAALSISTSSTAAAASSTMSHQSVITSAGDRYGATSNNNNNSAASERPTAKRARRTRNDNSGNSNNNNTNANINIGMDISGSGGGGSGTIDSLQMIDNQTKQLASTAGQSSSSSQKKAANSNNGGNGGNSSGTNAAAGNNNGGNNSGGGKKKKRKSGRQTNSSANVQAAAAAAAAAASSLRDNRDDTPPIEEAIDPDEPTYCLCDQISFGEMILCDNDLCPIEWFHFSCVSLMSKPKGKWFCPNCRGERPNVMKPKAQFLKELALYNKEKEEKT